ncbi:MAG: DUF1349 domain-containing protein [Anaerolineales bacterium]|nr:DUF1349 domain-containing protein [Anaerolineales bacterium]
MHWYNEPPQWEARGDNIIVTAGAKSDFWRITHYGFIRDNGHFYALDVGGDFQVDIEVAGEYRDLYDQAGLMLRLDAENWIKCGIEFVHGVQQASVVVTRGVSDWAVTPLPSNPPSIFLRLIRKGDGVEVYISEDSEQYRMLRLAFFPTAEFVQVGPMCAAPDGAGFRVTFRGFSLEAL